MANYEKIIKELDGADLFLRNRANAKPALLTKYDIELLLDIAKTCDDAARTIERLKYDLEFRERQIENLIDAMIREG